MGQAPRHPARTPTHPPGQFLRWFDSLSFFDHAGTACGILAPQPGAEPVLPTAEVQSLSCWTAREAPRSPPPPPHAFMKC